MTNVERICGNDDANLVIRYPTFGQLVTGATGHQLITNPGWIPTNLIYFTFDCTYETYEGNVGSVSNVEGYFNRRDNNTGSFFLTNPDNPLRVGTANEPDYYGQVVFDVQQAQARGQRVNPVVTTTNTPSRMSRYLSVSNVRTRYPDRTSQPVNFGVIVATSQGNDFYSWGNDEPRFEYSNCQEVNQYCPENTCEVICGDTICCYGSDGVAVTSFPRT